MHHFVLHWDGIYMACNPKTLSIRKIKEKRMIFLDTVFGVYNKDVLYDIIYFSLLKNISRIKFISSIRHVI